jgi:hypothetical protein
MKDSTTLDALVRRIDALERRNRRLQYGICALIVLAAGLTAMAAQAPSPKVPLTLTAERFTLVDSTGGARAELQAIAAFTRGAANPMLTFLDKDGHIVVRIGVGDRGPVLEALGRDGKLRNFFGGSTVWPATQ